MVVRRAALAATRTVVAEGPQGAVLLPTVRAESKPPRLFLGVPADHLLGGITFLG